jgi:hypothetical protein
MDFQSGKGSGHKPQVSWVVTVMDERYVVTVWALNGYRPIMDKHYTFT